MIEHTETISLEASILLGPDPGEPGTDASKLFDHLCSLLEERTCVALSYSEGVMYISTAGNDEHDFMAMIAAMSIIGHELNTP